MKVKPIELKDSDFVEGWGPPVVRRDNQERWITCLPERALQKVQTLSPERAQVLYEECAEICGNEGPSGPYRNRGMLYPAFPDQAWLQRQLELCGVQGNEPMALLYGDGWSASVVLEASTLLEFFYVFQPSIDDTFIEPISKEWLIYVYHHGATWFVRLD